jgi:hypothetical protein
MKSWDDFMDALGSKPEWAQYADQLRVQNMVKTAEQLSRFGVSYPTEYHGIRKNDTNS